MYYGNMRSRRRNRKKARAKGRAVRRARDAQHRMNMRGLGAAMPQTTMTEPFVWLGLTVLAYALIKKRKRR